MKQDYILDTPEFYKVLLKTRYGIDIDKYKVNQVMDMLSLISGALNAHKHMKELRNIQRKRGK